MAEYTIDKFSYDGNTYIFDKNDFVISLTVGYDSSYEYPYNYFIESSDKTFDEITAAYIQGKNLLIKVVPGTDFPTLEIPILHLMSVGEVFPPTVANYVFVCGYSYINTYNSKCYLDYWAVNIQTSDTSSWSITFYSQELPDRKVGVTLNTTTKAYLLGVTQTPTSYEQDFNAISDTGVYLDTTAGRLTATSFNGSGATLSSLNASNISTGTVPAARINGATLSSINASNISSGTIPAARINGVTITSFNASNISTGTIPAARVCGSTLSAINASNLSTGTLPNARLAESGATAGSYGPSSDIAPNAGSNFSVPYVTVDTYGRVTAAMTRNITMPSVGAAAAKGVDTSIEDGSSSTNLPTSAAVAAYVDAAAGGVEVYSGTTEPSSSIGQNGDLYVLLEGNSAGALVYYNSTTGKMQTADGTEVSALSYDVITSW